MTAHQFEHFKKIYKETDPPEYLKTKGWEDLSHRLSKQNKPVSPLWTYGFVYAGILLLATAGIVGAAQTATPGSALYPIKATSDHVLKSVTNSLDQKLLSPVVSQTPTKNIPPKHTPTPSIKRTDPTVTKKIDTQSAPTQKKTNTPSNNPSSNNNHINTENKQVEGIKIENNNNGNRGNSGNNGNNVNNGNKDKQEQKQADKQQQKSENPGRGNQKKN